MANAPRMYVQDVWNDTATNSISQVGGNSQGTVSVIESGSDVLQNQFESGILEENANKEGNSDVRREETIPDTSNAESTGRMGEKTAEGKGSNRERISRRIETLLRESSVEGRYNGLKRRGTGRVEKEETAEVTLFSKKIKDDFQKQEIVFFIILRSIHKVAKAYPR